MGTRVIPVSMPKAKLSMFEFGVGYQAFDAG
jgi:hypothetical protein